MMLQKYHLPFGLAVCFLLMYPFTSFAVEEFKVSKNGKGEQIWFEAEAFDDYEKAEAKKLPVQPEGLLTTTWGRLKQ